MKFLAGKWFVAVRFGNDLCVGVGNLPQSLIDEVQFDRPNKGVR